MKLSRRPLQIGLVSVMGLVSISGMRPALAGNPVPGIDGRSILLVRRPDPGFAYVTAGGALAGATAFFTAHDTRAGGEMNDAGRQLAAEDHLEDPAVAIGNTLLTDLVATYKLQVANPNASVVSDDRQLDALRKQNQVDLILEFYTDAWRTFYFLDGKHYDVWYYAKARLIDGRTGATLRHAKCAHRPTKTPNSPTLDELLADNGAKLHSAVDAAKQLCLTTIRDELGIAVAR